MSSKLRWLTLAALLAGSAAAASLSPAARSYYTARLAETAAGRFATLPLSPMVAPPTDPLLDAVVQWDRLRRDAGPASFAEIAAFLPRHPGWPQELVLRRRAEKLIDDTVQSPARLAYFRDYPPLSALAKFRLAEAQLIARRFAEANASARDAWDSAGLDAVSEGQLRLLFPAALTPEANLSRLDRMLWSGQVSAAQRVLPLVAPDRQAWANARIALRAGGPGAAAALASVPPALANDPGLLFDRVQWLKRTGNLAAARAAMAAYAGAPGFIVDPEQWLKLRLDLARGAVRDGQSEVAYTLAARHQAFPLGRPLSERTLGERQAFIDSEWLAGWVALRKLNRASVALVHFQRVRDAAMTPVSQARGDYWSGRAAEAAGLEARSYYAAAAAHADYYYGQLAAERLGPTLTLPAAAPVAISAAARARFDDDDIVRIVRALGDLGDRGRQTLFIKALVDRADTPESQRLLADLGRAIDRPDVGVMTGKAARADNEIALLDVAYPRIELPPALTPSWTMVHAIARQETQFDRAAVSSANARGLMQLLPATAAETAAKLGMAYNLSRLTEDPVYNVTLGAAYYGRMRDNLGGSNVLAVAAYNAGPGNVRKFLAANGDPRLPGVDIVDWVEQIPFAETRDYVQRVLSNAVVYDLLHPATAVMPTTNRLSAYMAKKTPG